MSELLTFVLGAEDKSRRQRLPSLYSDFTPQRHSNPDGFAANTAAWLKILEKATQAGLVTTDGGNRPTLSLETGDSLLRTLETKEWGTPLALKTVIDEALSQGQMVPYTDFVAARRSIYRRRWTIQPWWLLSWGVRQLGLYEPSTGASTIPKGRFVITRNVEEAANKIIKGMGSESNRIDRIHPMPLFKKEVEKLVNVEHGLTDTDLQIILTFLSRDRSILTYDAHTIKFKGPEETLSKLSEQDGTIASLKLLITNINEQVTRLSGRIDSLSESAQVSIQNKNRTSALAALRSKKLNENTLKQRSETLAQLEEAYGSIERAADQDTIVRVLESSTSVLRNLNAEVGGLEKVNCVVDGLRDEMSKVDEVSGALEVGAQEDFVIDESAVDEELQNIEREAKLRQEEAEASEVQNRLASIDNVDDKDKVEHLERQKLVQASNSPVERGTKALKRLSLDSPLEHNVTSVKVMEEAQTSIDRVPNSIPES